MVTADALQVPLVGAAIVLGIAAVIVSYWAGVANIDYIREYGSRTGQTDELFPIHARDIRERSARRPWLWLLEGPGRTWRTLRAASTPALDPELERLRQRYQFRRRAQIVVMIGALVAVMTAFWPR